MNKYEQWRADAIADGWISRPTYGDHEDEARMASLTKNGWQAQVDNRPVRPNGYDERRVSVWDAKGIVVIVEYPYSAESLQRGQRICQFCKATNVDTHRVSFAGRCCTACLPEQRKKLEYPGGTN